MLEELGSPENPKQHKFLDWAAETNIWDIRPKKENHLILPQLGFCNCLANFSRPARCLAVSRGFFCLLSGLQPSLFINLQMVFFPRTWPLLANCCESCLLEFPLLYLALFRILLATSLRIFGLSVLFLSSNPSFLDDHFTTQRSAFWKFLELTRQ